MLDGFEVGGRGGRDGGRREGECQSRGSGVKAHMWWQNKGQN